MSIITRTSHAIGRGALAGLAGTAAMTVSSTIEMKLRHRSASSAPATAAAKVLGIARFRSETSEERFGTLVHWGYGTGWGVFRGMLSAVGLSPKMAIVGHGAVMWGSEQAMLPALKVAPPLTQWGSKEISIDAWHHMVHVAATSIAYELLERREVNGSLREGS